MRVFSRLTVIHTYVHTLMAVASMQGAEQHIRSSLVFSILLKDMQTRGIEPLSFRLQEAGSAPEPQSPCVIENITILV